MKKLTPEQIAPYWSEEKQGVVIPLLGIVLDAKNIANGESWDYALALCIKAGKRMFTKKESYIIMWQKDEINAILKEHHGEPMKEYFWTNTEREKSFGNYAWYVNFSAGYISYNYESNAFTVRAVTEL